MNALNQSLKALGSLMSRLTSVWQTIWTKTRPRKVGQVSIVSSVYFGKTIQQKGTEIYGDQLVNDIKELKAKIATVDVDYKVMLTGAVDLLNEVATSKITGEEEIYSHTDLYDFRANIEGAEKIFQLFKPLLEKSDANLVKELEADFKSVNKLVGQTHDRQGTL